MKKIFPVFLFIAVMASIPFHSSGQETVYGENEILKDKIVAVVGNEIILLSDVWQQLNNMLLEQGQNPDNLPASVIETYMKDVLDDMINEQLLLVKAAQDSIEVDYRQVDLKKRSALQ